jgi:hypothetical protein
MLIIFSMYIYGCMHAPNATIKHIQQQQQIDDVRFLAFCLSLVLPGATSPTISDGQSIGLTVNASLSDLFPRSHFAYLQLILLSIL